MTKNYLLGLLVILALSMASAPKGFAASNPEFMIMGDYELGRTTGKFQPGVDSSVVLINPNNQNAMVTLAILDGAENVLLCKSLILSRLEIQEIQIKREIKKARKPIPANGVVAAIASFNDNPYDTPLVGYVRTFIRQGVFIAATKEGMRSIRSSDSSEPPGIQQLFKEDLCPQ